MDLLLNFSVWMQAHFPHTISLTHSPISWAWNGHTQKEKSHIHYGQYNFDFFNNVFFGSISAFGKLRSKIHNPSLWNLISHLQIQPLCSLIFSKTDKIDENSCTIYTRIQNHKDFSLQVIFMYIFGSALLLVLKSLTSILGKET